MKMLKEDYARMEAAFVENSAWVKEAFEEGTERGVTNVKVKMAFIAIRLFLEKGFISGQYDKGLNDSHIQTAAVKAYTVALNS